MFRKIFMWIKCLFHEEFNKFIKKPLPGKHGNLLLSGLLIVIVLGIVNSWNIVVSWYKLI